MQDDSRNNGDDSRSDVADFSQVSCYVV